MPYGHPEKCRPRPASMCGKGATINPSSLKGTTTTYTNNKKNSSQYGLHVYYNY